MNKYPETLQFTISDSLLWEVILLNIRTETITYGILKKRRLQEEERKLLKDVAEAELAVQRQCTQENIEHLEGFKARLEEMRKVKIESIITRSRARWYEKGEKSTAYFLGLEKRNYLCKLIPSLKYEARRITNQSEIIKVLEHHFRGFFFGKEASWKII